MTITINFCEKVKKTLLICKDWQTKGEVIFNIGPSKMKRMRYYDTCILRALEKRKKKRNKLRYMY